MFISFICVDITALHAESFSGRLMVKIFLFTIVYAEICLDLWMKNDEKR